HVLKQLSASWDAEASVHITGFENAPATDDGTYDLIVSNIPFGNFPVYDPKLTDPALSGKIHNYFFARGLEKLTDGGLMAYITTDAFLNSPSNRRARQYVLEKADFVGVAVLPDNLMKDTGNTEAPSHLLLVQKNEHKNGLKSEEH